MHLLTSIRYFLLVVASQILLESSATACSFEKFADSPHIRIFQSVWVVDTWGQACGFGISGSMEIRAVNEKTRETRTIAKLNDITVINMSSEEPNLLVIKLPNLVDMGDAVTELDDVRISYTFTPADDPEARANFQRWKRHPEDPQARDWYCRNIIAKMDPSNRASWNAVIGQGFPADHSTERRYCPDR